MSVSSQRPSVARGLGAVAALLGSLWLGGCAAPETRVQHFVEPGANWSNYRTFTIEDVSTISSPSLMALEQSIERVMVGKGYARSPQGGDLTLRYQVTLEQGERFTTQIIPTGRADLVRPTVESINDGKLLANAIDRDSGTVVWKAFAVKHLSERREPMTAEQMDAQVGHFFETFPSATR